MLIGLEIENFKGIAARQRVDFAPLTLLFGANSAGKSTILQALIYLHEVLSTGQADIDRTELGGQAVDLGGFGRLVHLHEFNRSIHVRVEFTTGGGLNPFHHVLEQDYLSDLDDELTDAWVEIAVGAEGGTPKVTRLTVGSVGEAKPLLELSAVAMESVALATIHTSHPLLAQGGIVETLGASASHAEKDHLGVLIATRPGTIVPALDESVAVEDDFGAEAAVEARHLIEMLSVGVLRQLVRILRRTLYLGPLRSVPPRYAVVASPAGQMEWLPGMRCLVTRLAHSWRVRTSGSRD